MLFVLLETSHHTRDCRARQSGGDNSRGGSKDPRERWHQILPNYYIPPSQCKIVLFREKKSEWIVWLIYNSFMPNYSISLIMKNNSKSIFIIWDTLYRVLTIQTILCQQVFSVISGVTIFSCKQSSVLQLTGMKPNVGLFSTDLAANSDFSVLLTCQMIHWVVVSMVVKSQRLIHSVSMGPVGARPTLSTTFLLALKVRGIWRTKVSGELAATCFKIQSKELRIALISRQAQEL